MKLRGRKAPLPSLGTSLHFRYHNRCDVLGKSAILPFYYIQRTESTTSPNDLAVLESTPRSSLSRVTPLLRLDSDDTVRRRRRKATLVCTKRAKDGKVRELWLLGRHQEAFAEFKRDPDPSDGMFMIEELRMGRGDIDRAFQVYETLIKSCDKLMDAQLADRVITSLANICLDNEQPHRAVPFLWKETRRLGVALTHRNFGCLVRACAKAGDAKTASELFDVLQAGKASAAPWKANSIDCTQLVQALIQCESSDTEALGRCLEVFDWMRTNDVEPAGPFYVVLLGACGKYPGGHERGKRVHDRISNSPLRNDVMINNALISMYGKCGSLSEARRVFDAMGKRSVVTWNAMIAAYAQGEGEEAIKLFKEMQQRGLQPNDRTLTSVLSACATVQDLNLGKRIHELIRRNPCRNDAVQVHNGLLAMYGRCGAIPEAELLFQEMAARDLATWNAMISIYSQAGDGQQAIALFKQMEKLGLNPDSRTMCSVLSACGDEFDLSLGEQLHARMLNSQIELNGYVAAALIFMYSKTNCLAEAETVWHAIKNDQKRRASELVSSWTAMIGAYGDHGRDDDALALFRVMTERNSSLLLQPNAVTITNVLTACSHSGRIDQARHLLDEMQHRFGIVPGIIHHNCMLDALARANRLEEARRYLEKMESTDTVSYMTLLSSARMHGDVTLVEEMARLVLERDPTHAAAPLLLDQTYAAQYTERDKVRRHMLQDNMNKVVGSTKIAIGRETHILLATYSTLNRRYPSDSDL
jgi:pentatricopeptide repeat protein